MRVLNFGSINIDYVYRVDHFVQPGETEAALSHQVFAGGKGLNQSLAMARAGLDVFHAGKIGAEGHFLIEILEKSHVNVSRISISEEATGHAIIQVDKEGHNCILIHGGANRDITDEFIMEALSDFGLGDFLVLQNEIANIGRIMERAHQQGMKIVFNPAPFDKDVLSYPLNLVDIFILNEVEAASLVRAEQSRHSHLPLPSTQILEPKQAACELNLLFPSALIVVTLGSEGAMAIDKGREYFQPAFKVKAVDTTAAGDTFSGYFIAGLSEGLAVQKSLELAARAASLCVTRHGAADSVPYRIEIQ